MACAPRCLTLLRLLVVCDTDSVMRCLETLQGVLLPPDPCPKSPEGESKETTDTWELVGLLCD